MQKKVRSKFELNDAWHFFKNTRANETASAAYAAVSARSLPPQ